MGQSMRILSVLFSGLLLACVSVSSLLAQPSTSKHILTIEPEASFQLPPDIEAKIKSTSSTFGEAINGERVVQTNIIKTPILTIATRSRLVFAFPNNQPPPPYIIVAAERAFIEVPRTDEDVAEITFRVVGSLDGPRQQDGDAGTNGGRGQNGGDGQQGRIGINGQTYDLPPVYILFQDIVVRAPLPTSSRILKLSFDGLDGGDGGVGGNGGRGGEWRTREGRRM